MENTSLTISLPRPMKDFIQAKLQEGRFSTPSEYIRSLIRNDQDVAARRLSETVGFHSVLSTESQKKPAATTRRSQNKRARRVP